MPQQSALLERLRAVVEQSRSRSGISGGQEIESLPSPTLREQDHQQDIRLKKKYANWLLGAVIGQLLIANGVFIAYAWAGKRWNLEAGVINVWLGATLVQVIGVVTIVTRYLFPRRDGAPAGGTD